MISTENKLKIVDYLQNGKKIEAIKFARETLQIDLKEAAELVRSIELEFFPNRKGFRVSKLSTSDPGLIVGSAFMAFGIIFFIVVVILGWMDISASKNSSIVKGHVVSLTYRSGGSTAPLIEYLHNGKKNTFQGEVWVEPSAYAVGEEVELLVNNLDNTQIIINGFVDRYFTMVLFAFFALVFGGLGALVRIFLRN